MTHRARERRTHGMRAPLAALLLLASFLLASACDDGGAPASADPQPTAQPTSAASRPTAAATRAARMLPVTPVSIDYTVANPAFDALPGTRAVFGEYEGGGYQIEVPGNWNGDVVYFAHGFRGNPPQLTVSAPPLREYLIGHGFAWAASSYTKNGYEPGAGARDTLALRAVFEREAGTPRREYVYGQSMGGHIVTLSLEQYPGAYDGAVSECGVVSGHEILDYFLSWGVLSSHLAGVDLYGSLTDAGEFGTILARDVAPALGPPDDPTAAGRAFASAILHLTGGERPFFREGFAANYAFNFGILVNAVGAAGPANAAASNLNTQYQVDAALGIDAATLNREIARVAPNETYRDPQTYPEFADMTGEISAPLLTIHDTGDLFVPIGLEQSYRRLVDDAGLADRLVQRAIRRSGHCNFTQAERIAAFEDMVTWVETGERPRGDDFTTSLADAGREWTTPLEANDPGGKR